MSADSQLRTGVTTVRNLVLTCDDVDEDESRTSAFPAAGQTVELGKDMGQVPATCVTRGRCLPDGPRPGG